MDWQCFMENFTGRLFPGPFSKILELITTGMDGVDTSFLFRTMTAVLTTCSRLVVITYMGCFTMGGCNMRHAKLRPVVR